MIGLILKRIPFGALALAGVLLFSLALFSRPQASDVALDEITLVTESGVSFTAYVAGPEDSKAGVLLVHDWFGPSDFYREVAARLGSDGYRVIAVDLYNGGREKPIGRRIP